MAKIRITDLTATSSLSPADVFPVVNVGEDVTYKVTVQDLSNNLTIVPSSSYSLTSSYSSYAVNGGVTSIIAGTGISIDSSTGDVTITNTGGGGGGGGPSGTNQQLQYNNGGSFGGVSKALFDGTTLRVTGSFSGSLTGSVFGSASYSTSSSYALSSSYSISSSYAVSASYTLSSSYAVSSSYSVTSSFTTTASFASTASYVNNLVQNVSITGSVVVSGSNGAGIFSQGATLVDYVSGISSTGSYMVWRAPFSCSVVALYGYYVGGTAPQINAARSGSSGYGKITGSNLTVNQENIWVAANTNGLQNANFNSGDSLQVIMSGSTNNQLAVQVDFIRKF